MHYGRDEAGKRTQGGVSLTLKTANSGESPSVGGSLLIVSHVGVFDHDGDLYVQGGFGRHLDAFAQAFDSVSLMTCVERVHAPPDDYRVSSQNLRLIRLPPIRWNSRASRLMTQIRAAVVAWWYLPVAISQCDYLHPRLPGLGALAAALANTTDRSTFLYMAGDWEAALGNRKGLFWTWAASLVGVFHKAVVRETLCFTAGEAVARTLGGPSDTIIPLMTTAIGEEHVLDPDSARVRASKQPRELLFVGTVWWGKGVHLLIEALSLLTAWDVDAVLRIVGVTDETRAWLEATIDDWGVGDRVIIESHMDWNRLIQRYEFSDVFVLPSVGGRGEGVPKVVLEALARGVPVVAADVGGVSQLIEDGRTGLLVEPGSAHSLAVAVKRLWLDRDLRQRLAASGPAIARKYALDGFMGKMLTRLTESNVCSGV